MFILISRFSRSTKGSGSRTFIFRFQDSNQELEKGATERRSKIISLYISYNITFKLLTKNCKWEQGRKGAREQNYIIYGAYIPS